MGKPRSPSFSLFLPLASIVSCLFLAIAVPAGGQEPKHRQQAWIEPDVDRPGSDVKILWLRGGAEACQEACAQNPLCKSYTYVKDGVAGRMEGCWLKDGVPPPVEDGCCVSGVKTDETVSLLLREPVLLPRETEKPPSGPEKEEVAPKPATEEPEIREERAPETGSGMRRVAGLDFAVASPKAAKPERKGISGAISPSPDDVGAGRRETRGLVFTAAPPVATARRVPVPEPVTVGTKATGTGKKEIRGVTYTASPTSGRKPFDKSQRTGAVTRRITGVDITAVPPQR